MTKLLDILGLTIEPVPLPFEVIRKDTPRTAKDTPDNTVYHAGLAFVQEWEDTDTVTDTRYNGQGTRSSAITKRDKDIIKRDGLDEERYVTLKPYWAAGISAQVTARSFRGKRGFSPRTLDNYWKAFAEAETPTLGR